MHWDIPIQKLECPKPVDENIYPTGSHPRYKDSIDRYATQTILNLDRDKTEWYSENVPYPSITVTRNQTTNYIFQNKQYDIHLDREGIIVIRHNNEQFVVKSVAIDFNNKNIVSFGAWFKGKSEELKQIMRWVPIVWISEIKTDGKKATFTITWPDTKKSYTFSVAIEYFHTLLQSCNRKEIRYDKDVIDTIYNDVDQFLDEDDNTTYKKIAGYINKLIIKLEKKK